MATNMQIIDVAMKAMTTRCDNWADALDVALAEIGVRVDEDESRRRAADGYGPISVLEDGRELWQSEMDGSISISGAAHTCCDDCRQGIDVGHDHPECASCEACQDCD